MRNWISTISISTVSAVLMMASGSAFAADLGAGPPPAPLPPPVPAFTWTGFYIGANLGGAWSDSSLRYSNPFTTTTGDVFGRCSVPTGATLPVPASPNSFGLSTDCTKSSSFIGGGQIGYNWQFSNFVLGAEAGGDWQHLVQRSFTLFGANTTTYNPFGSFANDTAYLRAEQNGLGTLLARIGYAPGNWMFYATGGLAIGEAKHSAIEVVAPGTTCTAFNSTTCRGVSDDNTKAGWAVGGGLEVKLWDNWSLGAEYLYVDLGSTSLTLPSLGSCTSTIFCNASTSKFEDREQLVRVKLNYYFGAPPPPPPAPVVTRY